MKLISLEQQEDGAVRLELTRIELRTLRDGVCEGVCSLLGQQDERERLIKQGATEEEAHRILVKQGRELDLVVLNFLANLRALREGLDEIIEELELE